jgi:hypothetical protein
VQRESLDVARSIWRSSRTLNDTEENILRDRLRWPIIATRDKAFNRRRSLYTSLPIVYKARMPEELVVSDLQFASRVVPVGFDRRDVDYDDAVGLIARKPARVAQHYVEVEAVPRWPEVCCTSAA